MAVVRVKNVRLAGFAAAVPDVIRTVDDDVQRTGSEDARKVGTSIGVTSRRIASEEVCASDLCVTAAERLLEELCWDRETVQAVLFVTQTPDCPVPATACMLQTRLGLSTNCAAMDISLGSSGYVYGLATASQFVHSMADGQENSGRVLLLVGDTITRFVSPDDKATSPLFGDAGSATALEFSSSAQASFFTLGTDGRGAEHLVVSAGGARHPRTNRPHEIAIQESGRASNAEDLKMNGAEVFSFALQAVPKMIAGTLAEAGWGVDDLDGIVLHQSNALMLNHLRKRLKIEEEKFVMALDGFGNTSCASIPLAMTHRWASDNPEQRRRLVLGGYGPGWSWGGAAITCEKVVVPEIVIHRSPQPEDVQDLKSRPTGIEPVATTEGHREAILPKNRLLIIGAGGFGREVLNWARDVQASSDVDWEVAGFLDSNEQALAGFDIDVPVLGESQTWEPQPGDRFICAVGEPSVRLKICRELQERGAQFITLIHPTASVGSRCRIGVGCIVCPGAIVTADATVGDFVALNVRACIAHDAQIGDGCTINNFCDITGNVKLGEGVFLGSHVSVTPSARIGDHARVGAGSVIVRPVRANTTVMGPTAKRLDLAVDPANQSDAA